MNLGTARKLTCATTILVVAIAATVIAAPPLNPTQRERLAPALVRSYETGNSSFRVIVHVKAPPAARIPLTPRGVPFPKARFQAIHTVLTQELDRLHGRLSANEMVVHHVFDLEPAFAVTVGRQGLQDLASDPNVTFVEDDLVLHALTALGLPLIHADVLHNLGFTGAGTSVAIIDTGVDYNHPSLGGGPIPNSKVVYGMDTTSDATTDGNDPYDCDINTSDPNHDAHGTAVASIAAGLPYQWADGKTFAGGVAPGAQILAYKASRKSECGTFYTSDVVKAINDAVNKRDTYNVVAINLSIGGGSWATACDDQAPLYANAITNAAQAGIAVAVAAGNENNKHAIDIPACVSSAISVGSVYDTNLAQVSYCKNDSCSEILCTDTAPDKAQAKTVPCYSNSDADLDVLAPSELLTAARGGGETTTYASGEGSFGGTSGATPYVTGSIALLHQVIPSLDAANARLLLAATGEPITDDNNVTTPLIDLQAAVAAVQNQQIGFGEPTYVEVRDPTGTATSTATLNTPGVITGVHVRVQIDHPNPAQLVVTLIAPDGTRIKLHDHTSSSGGIYALYPDEVTPAESLDALVGKTAAGTWTLEVTDDVATGTNVPWHLMGWSITATTGSSVGPPQFANYVVPVGAHKPGYNTAFWSTDLRILNPSSTTSATLTLYVIPEGADGTTDYYGVKLTVPAGSILSISDLLASQFGLTNDQANILVQADGLPFVLASRTYNSGGPSGTYGQFVGAKRGIDAIGAGDPDQIMLQLASNASFHTNLGFSEVAGQSVQVRVTLHDGDTGTVIGAPATYTLLPFSNRQINRIFQELGAGTSDNAYATVEVVGGSGRIEAYATTVDDVTGDAIYVPGAHASSASSQVVPIVASIHGNQTTFWVSDLRVLNAGSAAATVQIDYQPEMLSSGTAASITRTIDPGQELALDDIVAQVLGQNETKGSLHITRTSGSSPLLITSRTYNRGGTGTYGQFVPAVTSGFDGSQGVTVINLDKTAAFRSNLGICEVGGGTVTVRYALKDSTGQTLGVKSVTLGPYQVLHINDIFSDLGAAAQANTRVDLYLDASSNGGAFTAYGTLIDNDSGDGIYVPAASYQTQ